MPGKTEINIIFFYSASNEISMKTRSVINEFVWKDPQNFDIKVKEANYDQEKDLCKQYGVKGTPETLMFSNQKMVGRYYGELTAEEFEQSVMNIEGIKR